MTVANIIAGDPTPNPSPQGNRGEGSLAFSLAGRAGVGAVSPGPIQFVPLTL